MTKVVSYLVSVFLLGLAGRSPEATASFGRAQMAIAEKRYDVALAHLDAAIEADPTFWEAHREAGECLLKLDNPAKAFAHFSRWAELRPDDPAATGMITKASALIPVRPTASPASVPLKTRAPAPPPALGQVARQIGRPKPDSGVTAFVLSGSGGSTVPPIPDDAPTTMLDSMRRQAESVFRPRMSAVANSMKQFRAQLRRYEAACRGKSTAKVTEGTTYGSGSGSGTVHDADTGDRVATFTSESSWAESFRGVTWSSNEDTPACRSLDSDIDVLAGGIAGAMAGADAELARPPSVYAGIRDEVYKRLAAELW